jgi:protein-L-isoaspartate(D-aspartate) O-methyltransferase
MSSKNLANLLKEKGYLESKKIYDAFCKIDRKDFVLPDVQKHAYEDAPLSIGSGQTISQPSVVAFMLEKLNPQKNDKVLDIGCGSGWTTALLAEVSKEVVGIEVIPELKVFGEENISRYDFIEQGKVKLFCDDGYKGFLKEAPYDKILVSAALPEMGELPFIWKEQLNEGGVIVVPVKNSIYKLTKNKGEFIQEEYSGFTFVPLVKNNKDEE